MRSGASFERNKRTATPPCPETRWRGTNGTTQRSMSTADLLSRSWSESATLHRSKSSYVTSPTAPMVCPPFDHQRRLQHVPRGTSQSVRHDRGGTANRQARTSAGALQTLACTLSLRDGQQDLRQGNRHGGQAETRTWHPESSRCRPETLPSEHHDQYVLRRAPERHRPNLQCSEGAQNVRIFKGLARPRRGDLVGILLL